MPLAAWIVSLVGPVVARVLAQLSIAVVTYKGLDVAIKSLLSYARSSWSGIPADIAAYIAMSGINTALSIVAGAIVAHVALIPLKRMRIK